MVDENKEQHRKIISDLGVIGAQNKAIYDDFRIYVEDNFAKKDNSWAEKVLVYIGGTVITIIVMALMALVIKDSLYH